MARIMIMCTETYAPQALTTRQSSQTRRPVSMLTRRVKQVCIGTKIAWGMES